MCTFVVAILVERCLVTDFEVNTGHVVNLLFLMALMKIECTGMNQAACRYEDISVLYHSLGLLLGVNAMVLAGIK